MKFILISEHKIDQKQYLKMYDGDYIEHQSDVLIVYSVEDANTIIQKELIKKQKHLDFIIADFNSYEFYQEYCTFTQGIRKSNHTYSDKNFKLSSVPIFLMNNVLRVDRLYNSILDNDIENLFDGLVYKPDDYNRIGTFFTFLATGIDRWLDKLKSDLDDLDLNTGSDFTKVNLRILSARTHKLRILSPTFIENKKPLDYLWIGNSLRIIESTADKLTNLLKMYRQNPSLRKEKQIHEFLKTYSHLLKSENFYKSIYEQHFYHPNSRSYEEVDFINIAHNYSLNLPELFEVKLPNQRFFSKNNLHLLKPTQKYFHQIGTKYFNYFSSTINYDQIRQGFNTHDVNISNLNFQYSLLMGTDIDKQQNIAGLNNFMPTLKGNFRLLTYDDLIKRHHYLHLRVTRFGVQ